MRYIQGTDRDQTTLLPDAIDDYITENNSVRFMDAFVDSLDLTELNFTYSETKDTGRKPYNPADMLKLYIYGYLNKIRSSRRLERATYSNIEIMWLLLRLHPDFKTIADFRKDNKKAIKQVCREFTLLCKKLDLFGCELIAIDGSKFSASNSNHRNFTKDKLEKLIRKVDSQIDSYLKDMDHGDEAEKDVKQPTDEDLKEKIGQLRNRKEKYQELQSQLENSEETQISLTDPDSRMMKTPGGRDVSYNVQIVTDSKHKLIVTHEVTNDCNDQQQLHPMASEAKEVLDVDSLEAVADAGYWERQNIKKCQDDHICTYLPSPTKSQNKSLGLYTSDDFKYEPEIDTYRCPAGEILTYRGLRKRKKSGLTEKKYTTHACYACTQRQKCTRSKTTRYIYRWVDEEITDLLKKRVQENKEKLDLRKSLVEHPFGTLKHWMEHRHFLTRGLDKVSTEMSLSVLCYNLKRVLNIVDFKELMAAVS